MGYIGPIILILGGILAASGFIMSKNANAKDLIGKIAPYQGFIGVALLAWGIIDFIRSLKFMTDIFDFKVHWGIFFWGYIVSEVLLGFLLGMPLIAKWIPGESEAEVRAMDMQKKLNAYNTLIGAVGIVCAIAILYFNVKYTAARY